MNRDNDYSDEDVLVADYAIVFNYALSLCRNRDAAEEITQEAFFRAIKSRKKSPDICLNSTYICTIARNYYFDYLKKQKKFGNTEKEAADPFSMEDALRDKEDSFALHRALHRLKDPYKEVFSLKVFGQLNYTCIAKLFQKSDSWARVTYYRAKRMIIDIIREEENCDK